MIHGGGYRPSSFDSVISYRELTQMGRNGPAWNVPPPKVYGRKARLSPHCLPSLRYDVTTGSGDARPLDGARCLAVGGARAGGRNCGGCVARKRGAPGACRSSAEG